MKNMSLYVAIFKNCNLINKLNYLETHHPHIEITIQAKSNQIFFTVQVKNDVVANDRVSSRVDNLTMHCIFSCCPET